MSEEKNRREKEIFADALEIAPEERAAFLEEACGDDAELRRAVDALLEAFRDTPDFLEKPFGVESSKPDAPAPSGKPPQFIHDFKILREIGKGGMGTVFEAEQLSLNRKVALKILPSLFSFFDDVVLKFRREAEAGGRQSHPNIISIYAIGEHEGINYIAQELVENGTTLLHKIEESRKSEKQPSGYFREVANTIAKVADALEHAHGSGVIHRDIKPSNILITRDGEPKVADFGLAKIEDALALTRTGDFSGTPYYMSPEQVTHRKTKIDKRTDIYSLGVTLYEMLTLHLPFEGKSTIEVMKQICLVDPLDPHKTNPRVPHDLGVICLKAMEKSPENRYQSMAEFAEDLKRFLNGDVILARPAGVKTRVWKRVRRNPVVSVSICTALLLLVCFVGYELFYSIPQLKFERNQAKLERDKALVAERKAEEQAKIIQENYDRIIQLSDVKYLSQLRDEADTLWPSYPENIDRFKKWLSRSRDLLLRLDGHCLTLETLRAEAIPKDELSPREEDFSVKKAEWQFDDMQKSWWHDTLAELVSGMKDMGDEEDGLVKDMQSRLAFAETIEQRSIIEHEDRWNEAITSIKGRNECPQYDGLEIEPQLGFVPIDQDPESGLWEFAHLQTGEIPKRDDEGKIIRTEAMGLVFVLIPGGSFRMGCEKPSSENPVGTPNVDPDAGPDESPVHEVKLKAFLISKYEMTQGQWLRFTGANPSTYHPGRLTVTLLHPVEQINWQDSVKTLHRLKLRLPSEAEWEYATRAGTSTIWFTGDQKESLQGYANLADNYLKTHGGNPDWAYNDWLDDGFNIHGPVGSLLPNAFGLHDAIGNVFEWCRDECTRYDETPVDGTAYETDVNAIKALRGGAWDRTSVNARCGFRRGEVPLFRSSDQGLRPAASLH